MPPSLSPLPSSQLGALHSFGFEAQCQQLFCLQNESELQSLEEVLHPSQKSLVLGGGSNMIFLESFEGPVVLQCLKGREIIDESPDSITLRLGAGENWHDTVMWTLEQGWCGLENLALIPGSVGAAPVQNIGAYGRELKDVLRGLRVWDRENQVFTYFSTEQCQLSYRSSLFKKNIDRYLIVDVDLHLTLKPQLHLDYGDILQTLKSSKLENPSPLQVAQAVCAIRNRKLPDPKVLGNAGSFFKNPVISSAKASALKEKFPNCVTYHIDNDQVKCAAGWMIDHLGWRGKREGNVGVHETQALVLVHFGGGSGFELLQLARNIRSSVKECFDVDLEEEVNLIARNGRVSLS